MLASDVHAPRLVKSFLKRNAKRTGLEGPPLRWGTVRTQPDSSKVRLSVNVVRHQALRRVRNGVARFGFHSWKNPKMAARRTGKGPT